MVQGLVLKNVSFLALRHSEWAGRQSRTLPPAEFSHPSVFRGQPPPHPRSGREPTPKEGGLSGSFT